MCIRDSACPLREELRRNEADENRNELAHEPGAAQTDDRFQLRHRDEVYTERRGDDDTDANPARGQGRESAPEHGPPDVQVDRQPGEGRSSRIVRPPPEAKRDDVNREQRGKIPRRREERRGSLAVHIVALRLGWWTY